MITNVPCDFWRQRTWAALTPKAVTPGRKDELSGAPGATPAYGVGPSVPLWVFSFPSLQREMSIPCEGTQKPLRSLKTAGFVPQLLQKRAGWGSGWGTTLSHVRQGWGHHGLSVSKSQPQLEQTILISKRSIEPIKIISWTCSSDIIHLNMFQW